MFNINEYNKECEERFEEKTTKTFLHDGLMVINDYPPHEWVLSKEHVKSFITTSNKTLLKTFLESERKYWVDIFDNPPVRTRPVESDEWTRNIARIEIDRIESLLETLK